MAKEIAYVPISKVSPQNIEAPKKIDEPSYPDKGVSYAGYAKKFLGGGDYQLLKQYPYLQVFSATWAASNNEIAFNVSPHEGKTLYISDVAITTFTTSTVGMDCRMSFQSYNGGFALGTVVMRGGQNNSITIHYSAPIPITFVSYGIVPSAIISGQASVTVSGWYEDN